MQQYYEKLSWNLRM